MKIQIKSNLVFDREFLKKVKSQKERSKMATFMAYRYCEHQFNFQQINGKNKRLIVFGRDQRFANYWKCLDLDDLHNLLSIDREIQAECVNLQRGSVYVPLLGELCMVKSDAMGWLRCSYLGEIGEMSKMYSWDFGVTLNVQKSDIRVS